ncbi:UDP-forming cellulose synthase catalytic subunit [Lichenibacterium dinghuense]|uniref:UDP-forming cellulose synthase catalytic subunit n=1 Tax=Lichenibacterium dinghuense TaxID=2895977 RepID=UPI001EFF99D2|nr:UDP-forming cellulose synthase catalytic subunit [Lichenibacterium sp. 6Y81]
MNTTAVRASPPRPRRRPSSHGIEIAAGAVGLVALMAAVTVPLRPPQQAAVAALSFAVFLAARRVERRGMSVFLAMLSVLTSLRYVTWRALDTLGTGSPVEMALGGLLVAAELYAVVVLVFGYVQTLWPLGRKPVPLPDDVALWPSVDVFVPTYDEPLSVVRTTVLGCLAMDWPRDRLRVHLLDDGRRDAFARFAAEAGVGYIARPDNAHAKAGNLNHALGRTGGEHVAVFDSDHIPTRAFLQLTMGWMVREPRLALVQTPHHFYSPDPFERNLARGRRVPSESRLFYGLVQDGNDFWNAAFFCGSCAVLRRAALDEIGGFSTESVTEDAHTMLRLHRRGWDSAYLGLPLAAGLATERLRDHIAQRSRWARGMIQILRADNPALGRGLTLGQRVCYVQVVAHFLFAIPRTVFLVAPLAYLLCGLNLIAASPLAIAAYALPHIALAVGVNSRLAKNWRHSFWSEIYETVLALFLVRLTVHTLLMPKRARFNVTRKGSRLEEDFFDHGAAYPNAILAGLLGAGVVRGLAALLAGPGDLLTGQALVLNSVWAAFSLLVVLAALAVGGERRHESSSPRVKAALPATVHLADGRSLAATTRDVSRGGAALTVERPALADGTLDGAAPLRIGVDLGSGAVALPARLLGWDGDRMRVGWRPETIADEAAIVRLVFGRADAWVDWAPHAADRPLASLWQVLVSIGDHHARSAAALRGRRASRRSAAARRNDPGPTLAAAVSGEDEMNLELRP